MGLKGSTSSPSGESMWERGKAGRQGQLWRRWRALVHRSGPHLLETTMTERDVCHSRAISGRTSHLGAYPRRNGLKRRRVMPIVRLRGINLVPARNLGILRARAVHIWGLRCKARALGVWRAMMTQFSQCVSGSDQGGGKPREMGAKNMRKGTIHRTNLCLRLAHTQTDTRCQRRRSSAVCSLSGHSL